jgi:ribonuclease HI
MDKKRIEEIEARANEATPGPWIGDRRDGTVKYILYGANGAYVVYGNNEYGIMHDFDEEFIKHSRQDIPDLIAALREARDIIIEADSIYNTNGESNDYETAAVAVGMMAGHGRAALTECEELKRKLAEVREDSEKLYNLVELAYNVNPAYEYEFATGMKKHRDLLEKQS